MNKEDRWKFERIDIDLIDEADLNANKMKEEDFDKLCRNIGVSGLSSVPCCYKTSKGRFTIISGHHRVRACRKLGHKVIGIIYILEEEISKDEIIAIQLSHNSLHGDDDRSILRSLFHQIQSIDFKDFAHIEIDEVGTAPTCNLSLSPISERYTLSIILEGRAISDFDSLIADIKELSTKNDILILAGGDSLEMDYLTLAKMVSKQYDIKSSNLQFSKILELAVKQINKEKDDLGNND